MFVTGDQGCVQLRRRTGITVESTIGPDDVDVQLRRFSFEGAERNLLSADRVEISTTDPRGLVFVPLSWWADGRVHHSLSGFVHVNAMGGVRLFRTFEDAVNNDLHNAISVVAFTGAPLSIKVDVRDTGYHRLAGVRRFTFNTDRAAIDTTSLGDLFTEQFSAGNITGSGTIDCYFQTQRTVCGDGVDMSSELSVALPQIILRTDLGGQFDAILQLADAGDSKPVFYEISGIATRTGIEVDPGGLVVVAMDFVTSGEFALRIGETSGRILQENFSRIVQEQDLDFLLTEPSD
jgi:hypothetical protein